jgi:hypothetical protein
MSSRWPRVWRGLLVANFSVFVAMFSHVAAGGTRPGGVGLAIALTFATLASIAVVGKRMSLPRLTAAVAMSQVAFHLLFSVGSPTSGQMHQVSHHGLVTVTVGSVSDGAHLQHADGWMWLGHSLAAVLTIAFLLHGERAVWRLLATASRRLVVVLIGGLIVLPIRPALADVVVSATAFRPGRDGLGVVLSSLRHRGPPAATQLFVPPRV